MLLAPRHLRRTASGTRRAKPAIGIGQRLRNVDDEIRAIGVFVALAAAGWWLSSTPLAIVGVLGALTVGILFIWQRECLVGVSYRRRLSQSRALFGEEIALEIEIVNDKLLPLSWLEIKDDVPQALEINGGSVVSERTFVDTLVNVLPMLPFQRVRRHLTVACTHRGEFTFGPAQVSSGDPIGYRTQAAWARSLTPLLVYPKVFALAPEGIVSRVLLGNEKSRFELLEDPSRAAGVREYRAGDPLRSIDWRATARSTALLVREFEPSVSPRVAVFVDFRVLQFGLGSEDPPELEFTVAAAASLISAFAERNVPTGLFSSGAISGRALSYPTGTSPGTLAMMLEGLAKARPSSNLKFHDVLIGESRNLSRGTSVIVVASDFATPVNLALSELRRRCAVTTIFIETSNGSPPPSEVVTLSLRTRYSDDWSQREVLELAV